MIINIFRHTADSVAAHGPSGPVCIVHLHLKISFIRRSDQNQSVRTDAKMSVTDQNGSLLRVRHLLLKTVNIDIIVAAAMHFRKLHCTDPFRPAELTILTQAFSSVCFPFSAPLSDSFTRRSVSVDYCPVPHCTRNFPAI